MTFPCNMTLDLEEFRSQSHRVAAGCHGAVPSFAEALERKDRKVTLRRKCHSVLSLVNDYEHKGPLKELKLQDSAGVLIPG